ncbi:MAG: hypothetical protein ACI9FN_003086, partial [Saprospiraceae bacterium]
ESKYNIQFYYFSGWVTDININQTEVRSTLRKILDATFQSTSNYYYFKNDQLVITREGPIVSKVQLIDSAEYFSQDQSDDVGYTVSIVEKQQDLTESNWIVIGDPSAPEQKPKVDLTGHVLNNETLEPIEGAILYIDEYETGTTSDETGYFKFALPQGKYNMVVQSIGLKEAKLKIQLYATGDIDINLESLTLNIEEFVVRANRKQSIRAVNMGTESLKTENIKELPTLFGEVDLIRSALLLPGVQSASEFSSGINVRGGSSDQNLVLLNGAPIYNSSHLFGFSSAFSPDVVDGLELYKSSIPVKFGGRISSVLDVKMKDGDNKKWGLRGGISPVTSRITAQGPVIKNRTSLLLSGRSTYSDWILKRIQNASFRNSSANYYDGTAHLTSLIGQNDKFDISGYISNDDFQLNGDTSYIYQNFNIATHYKHSFSDKLFGTASLIYSKYGFNVKSELEAFDSFDLSYQIENREGKFHFSYAPREDHQVNFGIQIVNYKLSPGNLKPVTTESLISPIDVERENALESSIYVSDEWTISELFSVSAGMRVTLYNFLGPKTINVYRENASLTEQSIIGSTTFDKGDIIQNYGGLEWRVSARYALDDNSSIKAAVNRNRQYLSMLFNSATASPTATWKLSDSFIRPQTGDQFSLGYYRNIANDQIELSVEGYYKLISDMVDYKSGAELILNQHIETDILNGDGRAYGLEFLLKKNGKKLNGWVSYTYSRTKFRTNSPYLEDIINDGDWFPTNFDKPHDFTLAGFYRISKRFSASTTFNYSTGRPITLPVAKYEFANGIQLQYSRRNEFRVPDYMRLDLSLNLEGNHKKNKLAHSSWSLSVYNVLGRKNVYSIYFVNDQESTQGYKLSIFGKPIVTLTYNFRM